MKIKLFLIVMVLLSGFSVLAQKKSDTILIDAGKVNTKVLKPSVNRYLIYHTLGKDSARSGVQIWTRNIEYAQYNGKEAIVITQEWEERDTVRHRVKSVCDKVTFAPLYHKSWWFWKSFPAAEFDFVNKTALLNDIALSDADTASRRKWPWEAFKRSWSQYTLNWHLDLEVFPILPYKEGKTFLIPFYDPGSQPPQNVAYTVTGSDMLVGYNNQNIDCWLLSHESRGSKEIFWISKKTKEVLKLEQGFGKDRWRYKIKLGFSI
jgi:hypothetical protein